MMKISADCCIVGAGLSGLVLAERFASVGKKVVIIEKRPHLAGNCHDQYDENGALYHTYGPHYFRSNMPHVVNYLSKFTKWIKTDFKIKAFAQNRLWSFPVNLVTFEQLLGRPSSPDEFSDWLDLQRGKHVQPQNSEEAAILSVGRLFYDLFFKGYTIKQWGRHPKELSPSVCGRIPMRLVRDERYFSEDFQAMPLLGYTNLASNILESIRQKTKIFLDTDYFSIKDHIRCACTIYTGPIDEYYGYTYGPLPWRSLKFKLKTFTEGYSNKRNDFDSSSFFFQPSVQINYPNENQYTRSVEIKHVTRQNIPYTNVVYEYPSEYTIGLDPFYPIPSSENFTLIQRYTSLAKSETNVYFLGRLATYRYLNMDQVVAEALSLAQRLLTPVDDK